MGLKLLIGDAPILNGAVLWDELLAIALSEMGLQHEVAGEEAPRLRVPVHAAAANAIRRHEGAPAADRKRGLIHFVAEAEGQLRRAQEQLVPDAIAQLILVVGRREIGRRVAPGSALDGNDIEAGIGQFVSQDRSGPAKADDHNVFGGKLASHERLYALPGVQPARPWMATGGYG